MTLEGRLFGGSLAACLWREVLGAPHHHFPITEALGILGAS